MPVRFQPYCLLPSSSPTSQIPWYVTTYHGTLNILLNFRDTTTPDYKIAENTGSWRPSSGKSRILQGGNHFKLFPLRDDFIVCKTHRVTLLISGCSSHTPTSKLVRLIHQTQKAVSMVTGSSLFSINSEDYIRSSVCAMKNHIVRHRAERRPSLKHTFQLTVR